MSPTAPPRAHARDPIDGLPPQVFLRIDAPRRCAQAVTEVLAAHGADVQGIALQRDRVLVRAQVARACSQALQEELARIAGETLQVLSWVSGHRASARR